VVVRVDQLPWVDIGTFIVLPSKRPENHEHVSADPRAKVPHPYTAQMLRL